MKELSICQSSSCLVPVSFRVLGQIEPQAPRRGGALPPIPLSFSLATIISPEPKRSMISPKLQGAARAFTHSIPLSLAGIVYRQDYDGI